MIQKGVAGLRIISVKKLCRALISGNLFINMKDFYCHRNLYDLMIQKGKTGLGMIHSKNFLLTIFMNLYICIDDT